MMYGSYGGGVPGAPGNMGGVGAPVSFAGGVSPSVRISVVTIPQVLQFQTLALVAAVT